MNKWLSESPEGRKFELFSEAARRALEKANLKNSDLDMPKKDRSEKDKFYGFEYLPLEKPYPRDKTMDERHIRTKRLSNFGLEEESSRWTPLEIPPSLQIFKRSLGSTWSRFESREHPVSFDSNPFNHRHVQDEIVRKVAVKAVTAPEFVASEARIISSRLGSYLDFRRDYVDIAQNRFYSSVAPSLAAAIAQTAGHRATLFLMSHNVTKPIHIEAETLAQVNKVNLCPFQIYETVRSANVREAYTSAVVPRAEELSGRRKFSSDYLK